MRRVKAQVLDNESSNANEPEMSPLVAGILISGGGSTSRRFSIIVCSPVLGAPILVGICWEIRDKWIEGTRGRNWPTVSAVVDIVTVASMVDRTLPGKAYSSVSYYLATLTYIYSNPEQQMGDYSRRFGDKKRPRIGRIPTKALLSRST
jgi:hypothetical protein